MPQRFFLMPPSHRICRYREARKDSSSFAAPPWRDGRVRAAPFRYVMRAVFRPRDDAAV
jgi:hypothetical protein